MDAGPSNSTNIYNISDMCTNDCASHDIREMITSDIGNDADICSGRGDITVLARLDNAFAGDAIIVINMLDSRAVLTVRSGREEGIVDNTAAARLLVGLGVHTVPTISVTSDTTSEMSRRTGTSSSRVGASIETTLLRGSRATAVRETTAFAVTFRIGRETVAGRRMEVTGRGVGRIPVSATEGALVVSCAGGGRVIGEGTSLLVIAAVNEALEEGDDRIGADQQRGGLAGRMRLHEVGEDREAKTDTNVSCDHRLAVLQHRR